MRALGSVRRKEKLVERYSEEMRAEESIPATLAQGGRKEEPGRGPLPSCIQGGQGEGGHTCKVRARAGRGVNSRR